MNGAVNTARRMLAPIAMLLFGAVLGVAAKLLDIHTSNLGNIFSQMSVWILLVTLTVSMVVFDGPRVYDIVIMLVLAYSLFVHKVKR